MRSLWGVTTMTSDIPGIRFSFFFGSVRGFKEHKTQVLFVEYSFSKSKHLPYTGF